MVKLLANGRGINWANKVMASCEKWKVGSILGRSDHMLGLVDRVSTLREPGIRF